MKIREWIESTKTKYHPAWIRRVLEDPFSVPPIYIEPSPAGACNHRCTFCAPEMLGYKTNYLDHLVWQERVMEMKELRESDPDGLGVKCMQFAGEGEPMLHPKLGLLYEYTRNAGIDICMLSNGIALTEKRAYEILSFVNIYLQISINAGTADSYAAIHQTDPKDWERLWNNISKLVRARDELKSKCELGANLTVLFEPAKLDDGTIIPANWPEIELLVYRAKDAGLDYVSFKPYSQHPYSFETMKLYGKMKYDDKVDEVIRCSDELVATYQTPTFEVIPRISRFKEYDGERGYDRCLTVPTLWSYIQADGVWLSCSAHWTNTDFHLGNINRQTVKQIWFGDRRRQHLDFMKNFDVSVCRKGCHVDKENKLLFKLKNEPEQEREAELVAMESLPFPHRGNVI